MSDTEQFVDSMWIDVHNPDVVDVYWICMCAADECSMAPIGPFIHERHARMEANIGCMNAHFVVPRRGTFRQVQAEIDALRQSRSKYYERQDEHPEKYQGASLENLL